MLPKKNRVTKELFQTLMKEGKVLSGSFFLFRYMTSATPHFAFTAPKSIAKSAVVRNGLRRKGYRILQTIPLKHGLGVFFYKKSGITAPIEQIKEEIGVLLKKANIL